jgi:hypothetical protein
MRHRRLWRTGYGSLGRGARASAGGFAASQRQCPQEQQDAARQGKPVVTCCH